MDENTKELKKIEDLEELEVEEKKEKETPKKEEKQEEPKEKKKTKFSKKQIITICSVAAGLLVVLIIVFCLLLGKKKAVRPVRKVDPNTSLFVSTVQASLESGILDKEIQKGLKETGIKTNTVTLISLDIDSDGEQEVIAYAEGKDKKALLSLEVEEDIVYDENYPIDAKDALGYGYSSEKQETLWYALYSGNVVIIYDTKKIIKADDYINNYVGLTSQYKGKAILENGIEYKFNKKLDVEKLEEEEITNEKLLEDNNIKKEEAKDIYEKYKKEKDEKEAKEKEEAEKAKKEEEERQKTQGTLKLGNHNYQYGKYKIVTPDDEEDGYVTLYSDLTCIYKEQSCTFTVGEVRDGNDDLVPGIALSTGQMYITTVDDGVMAEPKTSYLLKYVG